MDNKISVFKDKCVEFHKQSVIDSINEAQNPNLNSEKVMIEKTEFLVRSLKNHDSTLVSTGCRMQAIVGTSR